MFSFFLGVQIKDEFTAWRPSCLKFSSNWETSLLQRKEKELTKEAKWWFIVLRVVLSCQLACERQTFLQVPQRRWARRNVCRSQASSHTIDHLFLKPIPFFYFLRDHLGSTLGITCSRESWGSIAVWGSFPGDHLRSGILCGTVQFHKKAEINKMVPFC